MRPVAHTFAILIVICVGSLKVAGKELKVLFIGNSHTYTMQGTLNSLVRASPHSGSTIEYLAKPGWNLRQHLNSGDTMPKIKSQDWDFVLLQENGQRAGRLHERELFYDAVATLSEAIRETGASVILYMTWGFYDNEDMRQNTIEGYRRAAHQVDAIVSPVGIAWQRVRRNRPHFEEQLYLSDGNHSSPKGSFLIACVLYTTLFDADPTLLEFSGSLPPAEAAYLKLKAKEVFNPIVDFNEDGIVDAADMCIMVDRWGTDDLLCDIGPMLWGDGIVDVQDLIVLADHLFEEVMPPELVAYWRLDETEGDIAHDSTTEHDSTLHGEPVWQPNAGQIAGTLEFDGIDDYLSTPFILNPAEGSISVFAWIKGGAPGQVILAQQTMADWLVIDAGGKLMTDVKCFGRGAGPLFSETVITDGSWRQIGLVWDGSSRSSPVMRLFFICRACGRLLAQKSILQLLTSSGPSDP